MSVALERQVPRDASAPPPAVVVVRSLHYDIMLDAPDRQRKGRLLPGEVGRLNSAARGVIRPSPRAVEVHPLLWSAPLGTTVSARRF